MSDRLLSGAFNPDEWDRIGWLTDRERSQCRGARARERRAARAAAKSLVLEAIGIDSSMVDPVDLEWVPDRHDRPGLRAGGDLAGRLPGGDWSVSWSHTSELVTVLLAPPSTL